MSTITMNNCAKGAFIFTVGIAVGAVITYKYMANRDEYIEEVAIDDKPFDKAIASYSQLEPLQTDDKKEQETKSVVESVDISKTYKTSEKESVNYSDMYKNDTLKAEEKDVEIHIIDSCDYGEDVDYTFSFTLYSDGVLADEMDDEISHPESRIGKGTLSEFIKSDLDELYIRNNRTKSDYEILKDERRYFDVVGD